MTREEELQAFYVLALPGFLEYLRTHQSRIEDVELATVKDGIVSFPATQTLGGVQKTVRVPLTLLTTSLSQAETLAREEAAYARQQGDYAKAQAEAVSDAGDYAEEQGDYAKAKGDEALAIKNTVTLWYNPFRDNVEQWADDAATAESQRVAAEQVRSNQESTRVSQENSRSAAELLRVSAENYRIAAEQERAAAELLRIREELERKAAESQRQQNEEARLDGVFRQNTVTGMWERLNQRTGVWESTGNYWLGGLMAYRFYTDPATGRIHVVKNSADRISFSLVNGRLKACYVE